MDFTSIQIYLTFLHGNFTIETIENITALQWERENLYGI